MAPGTQFAGFVVRGVIGRGGMAVVYRAADEQLQRDVALKLIAPALARDGAFRERFAQEWRLAARIEHPNVVPIYAAGDESGQLYIAMRFVSGSDLGAILGDGRLEPEQAIRVTEQVASALEAAHQRGLVHRDVKPGNVLVSADDAYLTDFGITVDRRGQHAHAEPGRIAGTVAYMAPEQIRGAEVDPRTDVYALGGLLHHCLTGEPPFAVEHDLDALTAHLSAEPPRPSTIVPDLPTALDDVIQTAMSKDPSRRFPSALALAEAAAAALRSRPLPTGGRTSLPATRRRLVGREPDAIRVKTLLEDPDARIVTVTGAGGIGKTQLAVAIARSCAASFPDGVFFVALEDVDNASELRVAITQSIGLHAPGADPTTEWLADRLADRRLLLVLDNLEQVRDAAPDVALLSRLAPDLSLLVTSQAPMRVDGEQVVLLHGLRVPDDGMTDPEILERVPSVALLLERAAGAGAELTVSAGNAEAIAQICRTLDGLPLALELAAARLTLLDPTTLLGELQRGLTALGPGRSDAAPRQRGMRAALDHTCALLDDGARGLLADLSVFAGGFTVALAEAVEGRSVVDRLAALNDLSLLRREPNARIAMPPPVRLYADSMLRDAGRADGVRRRHAQALVSLAEPFERDWLREPGRMRAVLSAEAENLRAAFIWAREHDPELHARLAAATGYWLFNTVNHLWGQAEVEAALIYTADAEPRLRARVQQCYVGCAIITSQPHLADGAVEAWKQLGEPAPLSLALAGRSLAKAYAYDEPGALEDATEARRVAAEATEPWFADHADVAYAEALYAMGDAAATLEVVDRLAQRGGPDWPAIVARSVRGDALVALDRPAEALVDYADVIGAVSEIDCAFQLDGIAMALAALGHHRDALMVAALSGRCRGMWSVPARTEGDWFENMDRVLAPARRALTVAEQRECRARMTTMPVDAAISWAQQTARDAAATAR
jgi:non-specific serine/threonine protein kinase